MGREKKFVKKKPKKGRKPRHQRRAYPLSVKNRAIHMRTVDMMSAKDVRKKLAEDLGYEICSSTLATWTNGALARRLDAVGPERANSNDTRLSDIQRPAILVDMENILVRKVTAILLTGVPYTRQIIQLLAVHIFHKLLSLGLYDATGKRLNPGETIPQHVITSVEHSRLVNRYLASSSAKTEFHRDCNVGKNAGGKWHCKMCQRIFKNQVNMTLHVYWHTIKEQGAAFDPDVPDEHTQNILGVKFVASPGWVYNFARRHRITRFWHTGEKGSADYDAVTPWVHEWLNFLYTDYFIRHDKTLAQIINIVVNFDECGFQYKSLPRYSFLVRGQE